jgi:NTP pyrophosphatase (non-canonical NTP hydrolase)
MTFEDYEIAAARTINARLNEKDRLMDAAAGLNEEAGEILGLVRKHLFQSRPLVRDDLELELGDALWCLAITAQSAGLTLSQIAQRNIAKLSARHPDGYRDAQKSHGSQSSF